MKKILCFIVIIANILFVCSCKKDDLENDYKKINIVTTIFPQYDFARAVAKEKANIEMLLKPGMESHSYDPTPQDIIKIKNSDIFIYTGGESDDWVNEIISSINPYKTKIISLMNITENLKEETVEGMQQDAEEGKDDEYDEHVWTSPQNAIKIVEEICSEICFKDSKNKQYYLQNAKDYKNRLIDIDNEFKDVVSKASINTIVFGDRFPFRYFTERYNIKYYAAFPGCSDESEPSAKTLAFLINKVKSEHIPVVFYTEFSNEKIADTICEATGVKKLLLHSAHNVSKTDFESGTTYVDIMQKNLQNIREALK